VTASRRCHCYPSSIEDDERGRYTLLRLLIDAPQSMLTWIKDSNAYFLHNTKIRSQRVGIEVDTMSQWKILDAAFMVAVTSSKRSPSGPAGKALERADMS
jgi:hypothetical protein